jgi:hypothetical protein
MHTGMMWLLTKTAKLTLDQQILQATAYYHKKYGRQPDLCLVHPSLITDLNQEAVNAMKITVRPYRPVLPGHVWIGVEDKPDSSKEKTS